MWYKFLWWKEILYAYTLSIHIQNHQLTQVFLSSMKEFPNLTPQSHKLNFLEPLCFDLLNSVNTEISKATRCEWKNVNICSTQEMEAEILWIHQPVKVLQSSYRCTILLEATWITPWPLKIILFGTKGLLWNSLIRNLICWYKSCK